MTSPSIQAGAEEFEEQRDLLFGVAYRMLGSAAEAEDLVQDAYLRYRMADQGEVRNPRSYLVTIVTRLCLDHLKSARVQRERYIGPWLPEPVLTTENDWRLVPEGLIDLRESVSMAFLLLLERLGPVERAVLLLHDVFDYSHAEIAAIVGRGEPACRQVLKRARDRISEGRRRHTPSLERQRVLTGRFLHAASTGDISALIELLAEDVTAYSDGGGRVAAAINPVHSADHVARFLAGLPKKEPITRVDLQEINGQVAFLTWQDHRLTNVVLLETDDERVTAVYVQRNPDKVRRLRRSLAAAGASKG